MPNALRRGMILGFSVSARLRRFSAAALVASLLASSTNPAKPSLLIAAPSPTEVAARAGGLPTPDSPRGVVLALAASYGQRNLEAFANLLSADMRFEFGTALERLRYPAGWTRDDEIASARRLFAGGTNAMGALVPAAASIDVDMGAFEVVPDPTRPDDPAYAVVVARDVRLRFAFTDGTEVCTGPDRHEFLVVRGDAATLVPGQQADADHWYVWHWIENARTEALIACYP